MSNVELIGPDGAVIELSESQATERLKVPGYRRVSDAERVSATRGTATERQYSTPENVAKGSAEALGRGLSLGLSDRALIGEFGVDPEDIAGRQDALGGVGTALELTGALGGALATGGGSLANLVAKTPAGALARLSAKIGDAAAKKLGGGTLAATAGFMVDGAIEGSVWNTANALSQAAIHNKELTGEDLAGAFLAGGLTGVVGGGLAGGSLALAKRAQKSVRKLIEAGSEEGAALANSADNLFTGMRKVEDDVLAPTRVVGSQVDDVGDLGSALRAKPEDLDELRVARKALEDDLGELTGKSFVRKLSADNPEEAVATLKLYGNYVNKANKLPQAEALIVPLDEGIKQAVVGIAAAKFGTRAAKSLMDRAPEIAVAFEVASGAAEAAGLDINPLPPGAMAALSLLAVSKYGGKAAKARGASRLSKFVAGAAGSRVGATALGDAVGSIAGRGLPQSAARGVGSALGFQGGKDLVTGAARAVRGIDEDLVQIALREQRANRRIVGALNRMSKGQRRSTPVKLKTMSVLRDFLAGEPERKKEKNLTDDQNEFLRAREKLNRLMGNPEQTLGQISEATGVLGLIDPDLGRKTSEHSWAALQFLHSKLPWNPGTQQSMFGDTWAPNPGEVQAWLRYARAVFDPASVYEDLASGRLTAEAAEVARELNGAHLSEIVSYMAENHDSMKKLSVQSLTQLSVLTGQAAHPSMNQFNALQATFRRLDEERAQNAQQQLDSGSGGATLNQPTRTQEIEAR